MAGERLLGHPDGKKALDDLHDKSLNFDLDEGEQLTPENGWHVDDYRQPLPGEPPGLPVPGGSWEVARRLMRDYEFADPSIIRAIYHPDEPLEKRDMLLEARFFGLRFSFGVRVGGVRDETREISGRQVRVWGWSYRTLEGHLEAGQMDYEVWKWLDSGEVEFRVHRFVRPARIANPLVRLGFRLFARRACQRMALLTAAELAHAADAKPVPRAADTITVRQAPDADSPRKRRAAMRRRANR
jgi:uncharacterized protein (UPF0548 family)